MISAWLNQHWHALMMTLKQLAMTPIASLLSILVVGAAFSLPLGAYTLFENVKSFSIRMDSTPQLSLYFKLKVNQTEIDLIRSQLEAHPNVSSFQFIPKDVALQRLQKSSGLIDITNSLTRNPLPDAFIVNTLDATPETLKKIQLDMKQWPAIESVQFDAEWANRLDALLQFGKLIILILATILSVTLVIVMFNTIRLQILMKRDEIEVSKLIGATDAFIRRPFLYFGAIQGLVGGAAAWLIIALIIQLMNDELINLAQHYSIDLQLTHISLQDSISMLLFSSWLGWLGARLSVASHLWLIEPH